MRRIAEEDMHIVVSADNTIFVVVGVIIIAFIIWNEIKVRRNGKN